MHEGSTAVDKLAAFSESFSNFAGMTRQLQAAYQELEQRYEDLNKKLQNTNIELRQSLGEKERLSSYLNNILGNLNSGVMVIDDEGRVRLFNRAAERILKLNSKNILGKAWADIIDEPDRTTGCWGTLNTGRVFTDEEKVVVNGEGSPVNIGFSTSRLRDPENQIMGAVEVFYDLTKLKKLEKEMARISTLAALGKMSATIAHEIRNPLGAISGFTALLDRDTAEGDPRKKTVGKIAFGISNLNRIVNDLLDYAREPKIKRIPLELPELIDEVLENVKNEAVQRNVEICKEIGSDVDLYLLDKDKFRQILINLVKNALQASSEGNKVKVVLRRHKSDIRIEIVDEGAGIEDEIIDKVFEPFFTTREKGTGLGLAIVKKLVQAHGGTVFAESGGAEKGARFVISLPPVESERNLSGGYGKK